MAQNLNQFVQTPEQGQLDLSVNVNTVSAIVDSAVSTAFPAGQAVKLTDVSGKLFVVTPCTADEDDVFGFVEYDLKQSSFKGGDRVNVSAFRGNVMYMTASAAIARFADVMIVPASDKVVTATSTNRIIGKALDKASGDGSLIRVLIDLPGQLKA